MWGFLPSLPSLLPPGSSLYQCQPATSSSSPGTSSEHRSERRTEQSASNPEADRNSEMNADGTLLVGSRQARGGGGTIVLLLV